MADIKQSLFYQDDDFAVVLWEGDVGDVLRIVADKPMRRADFASFTVMLRGGFKMISPSGVEKWRYTQGSTSDDGGDFDEAGEWQWTAVEDVTQELCFSTLKPGSGGDGATRMEGDGVPHSVVDMKDGEAVVLPAGCLAVVARGAVETSKGVLRAPFFARADNATRVVAMGSARMVMVLRS